MILVLDLKHKNNFDVKVQDAEIGLLLLRHKQLSFLKWKEQAMIELFAKLTG